MKFLIFNIAIISALYYLFTNDVNDARNITNDVRQAISQIETMASSAVAETHQQTSVKETAQSDPEFEPKPESLPLIPPPVSIAMRPQMVPEEIVAVTPVNDEPAEVISVKSSAERRNELLEMAQNMELLYLRNAGK